MLSDTPASHETIAMNDTTILRFHIAILKGGKFQDF